MTLVRDLIAELERVFRRHRDDKRRAHEESWPLLEQATRDPRFLGAAFEAYVRQPGSLGKPSWPVVNMTLDLNPYFSLVANCWVPLPGRETHWSTTAIHHHGDMLLSTCTAFGAYQHLYFDKPERLDDGDLFRIDLVEDTPHPRHHLLFVDAWRPHCPLYPAGVTATLAIWSHRFPVSWRDHAKRLPFVKGREQKLASLVKRLGLARQLDLRAVDYYDYYPTDRGFIGMRTRQQIPTGPVEDHVRNVLCILQATGHESLAPTVADMLSRVADARAREVGATLLEDMRRGRPIEGRLAPEQFGIPHMHFTRDAIEHALAVQRKKEAHRARELAAS